MNCDLIVIGAGPGGYEVAARESSKGKSVVIIEKDLAGGTCLNRGCIPTKCLCAGAAVIGHIARSVEFGIGIEGTPQPDFAKAQERTGRIVGQLRDGVGAMLAKCRFVQAEASVTADGGVKAGDETYYAPTVIIATGSVPARLPIPGAELAIMSDDFLKLDRLPAELAIVGGGVIGLEMAYIAAAYGTKVTVIEYCKEILPPFDSEVAKRLRLLLSAKGITFVTSASVRALEKDGERVKVVYDDTKGSHELVVDAAMMAVGRRAVLPDGLREAGIEVNERGFIVTDDVTFQTTREGFYAAGDCNGRMMLAHAAAAQAMTIVGEKKNLTVIPSAVFTSPELAMVGLTTEQCKAQGHAYKAHKALYRANGKALANGEADGLVKILVEPETGRILGAHILGEHASDLIQEIALAMANGLTADAVVSTVHGHPTLSELLPSSLC